MTTYSVNLIGPSEITRLINGELGKQVYIMGEYHEKANKCINGVNSINIEAFLLNVAAYYEQLPFINIKDINEPTMDIFLEVPYIGKTTSRQPRRRNVNQYLDDIENLFVGCLVKEGKNPACPKRTRFHFADIRRIVPENIKSVKPNEFPYASCLVDMEDLADMIKLGDKYRDGFIEYLKKWTSDDIFSVKEIKKQFENNPSKPNYINTKHANLLKNITLEKMEMLETQKISLTNSFDDFGSKPVDFYKEIRRNMDNPRIDATNAFSIFEFETRNKSKKYERKNIGKWLVDRVALNMDTYLLARLLKEYVKTAIVYVGIYHSRYCIQTLERLGFIKTNEEKDSGPGNNGFQCLSLNNFPELSYYANADQSKIKFWNPNSTVQNRPRIPSRKIFQRKINKKRVIKRRQRNIRKYKKHKKQH